MSSRNVKLWILFREATEVDMRLIDPYGHSIGELEPRRSVIIHAFAFERSLIDAYIASHRGLHLFLKKEKHTDEYCTQFENMNLSQKISYHPLHTIDDEGGVVQYTVAMTFAERATIDNYQRHPSKIFNPRYDYMNMKDDLHGALLRLNYNEFFNDGHFGSSDKKAYFENNSLKSGVLFDEFWLFEKMIRESPAYYERR